MENVSKQDRVASRTTADLERKYQFGRSFAEAEQRVEDLDKSLDQEGVLDRLTDSGKAKGLTRDENGNLFFNADYVNAGKLSGITLRAEDDSGNYVEIGRGMISAGNGYSPHFSLGPTTEPGIYKLYLDNYNSYGEPVRGSLMWNQLSLGTREQDNAPFEVTASSGRGSERSSVLLRLPAEEDHYNDHEKELYVYWKSNGDGSFSLVGYEEELSS